MVGLKTALQDQIDNSVEDGVAQARSRLPVGQSLLFCEECESPIPEARRKAVTGVRLCVACQSESDKRQNDLSKVNRRASKDSQLR
ncbi:transcriptional regulator, TraR/DksA family protein [Shewanella sediminis HAW-EB3]|uniref:Transcriptional regulator, TraR/DksA family protein n=1 Tax=Shewanella sediminis (strain HAW-EB3) TaxID=425104 RepID=A8G159_SHESH|nr:transcriptional regulator, TraR/DksA family protein [Shewanella sediminis HAW-EB3]